MDTSTLIKNYQQLNNSSQKKAAFNLGVDAGFFSEFNNMVLAILYCLKNGLRFSLYSKKANFALKNGWSDFFKPFCEESSFFLHSRYNKRGYQVKNAKQLPPAVLKLLTGNEYLTQDIWDSFRSQEFSNSEFHIPELGLENANLLEATQVIIKMIWNYNTESEKIIADYKNSINLPEDFVALHIRSGDKKIEADIYAIETYINKANALDTAKNAFVLTDDFSIINQLKKKYTDWNFFTLCQPSERGYVHTEFLKKDKQHRFLQHLKLFASLDICAESKNFIGTYSSNPGMFMGMRIGEEKCSCVDYDSWVLW